MGAELPAHLFTCHQHPRHPIDGVDAAWWITSTFSLQVSRLCSICPKHERKCFASLWRSPSSPAYGIGLQDRLSQVVFPALPPASLAKGQTVPLPRRPFVHIGCHLGTPSLSHPTIRPQPFFNLPHSPLPLLPFTDVVFCPWKWPRGHIGCELPAERCPSGPPWLLRSPCTAQFLPPGPDVLLFVSCFDFGRKFVSDVTGQPMTSISLYTFPFPRLFLLLRILALHMKSPSMQNSSGIFSLVIFRGVSSRTMKLRSWHSRFALRKFQKPRDSPSPPPHPPKIALDHRIRSPEWRWNRWKKEYPFCCDVPGFVWRSKLAPTQEPGSVWPRQCCSCQGARREGSDSHQPVPTGISVLRPLRHARLPWSRRLRVKSPQDRSCCLPTLRC